MVKHKYNIGESIEVIGSYNKTKIIDFEIFGDLVLYYTEDKKAYPQNMIQPYGLNFISKLFKLSDNEKNKQLKETFDVVFNNYHQI
jgi:hypothetical protein